MPPEKTVYIVNGLNFTARSLAKRLLLDGYKVILSGTLGGIDVVKLASLKNDPNFSFAPSDNFEKSFKEKKDIGVIYFFPEKFIDNGNDPVNLKICLDYAVKNGAKVVLISHLNVYQGVVSAGSVENYFGTSEADEAKFSQIESRRYLEAVCWKHRKAYGAKVCVCRLGDVFGPGMDFLSQNPIEEMLKDALDNLPIRVFGNGLQKHFAIYIHDAVEALSKCAVVEEVLGKIIPVANTTPVAEIEFAYLLKGIARRGLEIKFLPRPDAPIFADQEELPTSGCSSLSWKAKFSLKDAVLDTFTQLGYFNNTKPPKETVKIDLLKEESYKVPRIFRWKRDLAPIKTIGGLEGGGGLEGKEGIDEKDRNKKKTGDWLFSILGSLVFIAIFPAFYFFANLATGTISANRANYNLAESAFLRAYFIPQIIRTPLAILNKESFLEDFQSLVSGYYHLSSYRGEYGNVLLLSQKIAFALSPNSVTFIASKEDIAGGRQDSLSGNQHLGQMLAQFAKIRSPLLKGLSLRYFSSYAGVMEYIPGLLSDLPNILGYTNKKEYLILFQRSNQITATGGVVESYADITLDKGKITAISVDDIKNVDVKTDKLSSSIVPEPVKVLSKREDFDIRDSLWNPDFPSSARDLINVFTNVTGKTYDGVIAVDTNFLATLLKEIGEVYLSMYDLEINDQNILEKMQSFQDETTGGGTQKKTFTTNLAHKILAQSFEKNIKPAEFLKSIADSFNSKHIIAYFPESSFFGKLNWDGKNANTKNADYLMAVDANLGGTKTNPFITRSISYFVTSSKDPSYLSGTATISYSHTGETNAWPVGSYINFLRVYVPRGAKLQTATLKNLEDSKEINILNGVQVVDIATLTEFGTSFELKAKNSVSLEFSYLYPKDQTDWSNGIYQLAVIKQPGIVDGQFSLTINGKEQPAVNLDSDKDITVVLK